MGSGASLSVSNAIDNLPYLVGCITIYLIVLGILKVLSKIKIKKQ